MNTKEAQFKSIIQQHERTIYTVCYMFSTDACEVDDLYQEILIRLWRGFETFEGRSDIRTWIYRVSLNYCINFSRRRSRSAGGWTAASVRTRTAALSGTCR